MQTKNTKNIFRSVVAMALAAATFVGLEARPLEFVSLDHVPGEVLVKFKAGTGDSSRRSVMARGPSHKQVGRSGMYLMKLNRGETVAAAVRSLSTVAGVEYAQPNYIYRAFAIPDDPRFDQLWGLRNTVQTINDPHASDNAAGVNNGTGFAAAGNDMNMTAAWDVTTDCSSTIVAVIDSGVNYNHVDLGANMWDGSGSCKDESGATIPGGCPKHGWNFADGNNDPMDTDGHGTHVAGTIAARGNNGIGSVGVCWSAKVMAIRSLKHGGGTTVSIVNGLNFAVHNGAKVINMSLGGSSFDGAFYSALQNARDNGVVVVVAAGNDNLNVGSNAVYPCRYSVDNIICVGAVDQGLRKSSFSNYSSTYVDISAPGSNIISTWPLSAPTTTTIPLASGWTANPGGGSWGMISDCSGGEPALVLPSDWCTNPSAVYANSIDHALYRSFALDSGADTVKIDLVAALDFSSIDYLRVNYAGGSSDPFSGGTQIAEYTNVATGGAVVPLAYELPDCAGQSNCSLGFRVQTNASSANFGTAIFLLKLTQENFENSTYDLLNGTSMAAPHVAGVAALLRAYNPAYTYQDIINAVYEGGRFTTNMSGYNRTRKTVDGNASLRYISKTTGVGVVVN